MLKLREVVATGAVTALLVMSTPNLARSIAGLSAPPSAPVRVSIVEPVKHKNYKRRDPETGEVIAGIILLGILGIAAANSDDHYDDYYTETHKNWMRTAARSCRQAARRWFRNRYPAKAQVNVKHMTYRGNARYHVDGVVSNRNNRNRHRFVCNTRYGSVIKFHVS